MLYKKGITALLSAFVLFSSLSAQGTHEDLFPTPDILKDRVEFWKKIYTKYSLNDGVIHDRDYPAIVYGEIFGNATTANVKREKERIIASLANINSQPENTWTKEEHAIAALFRAHASAELLKDAAERIRFQQGQADRFKEGLIRSGMYLDTIRSILREKGIPERLAYLPHVESSFNTAAYSKVGAAGLWQFMRGTGKLFGMKITYTIDERRDPIVATRGAARYLSTAYSELKAWPLAITSYNHGINGMKRAVNETGSRDLGYIIQNYESRSFKFASSNFYSCFLAASEIAMNYKTYFPTLTINPRLEFTDLTLTHYIRPDVLCKYMNISTEQLIRLNPAIRSAVFEQHAKLSAGLTIHVPSTLGSPVALLAAIPDSLKSSAPERAQYYKVSKGDNLSSIASRLGVSLQELANENDLGRKSTIAIGQLLRVPSAKAAEKAPPVFASITPAGATEKQQSPVVKDTQTVALANTEALKEISEKEIELQQPPEETSRKKEGKKALPVLPPPVPREITAEKKDTAPTLVEQVADSLKELAIAPAVESKAERMNGRPTVQGNFDISIYNLDIAMSPVGTSAEITVSLDETIGHYADWLGIATWKIRKLNNMGSGSDIRLNKQLHIPVEQKNVIDQFIETRLQYHMAIEEDFYSQYRISDVKSRIIKKGETLWDICNQSDNENALPIWLFKKYNKHIDLNTIAPGITVWIPVISERSAEDIAKGTTEYPGYYSPFVQPVRAGNSESQRLP